jgi:hypothetical protein
MVNHNWKAGGTPLTMRSGGIARLGYQEGGLTMTQFGTPQEEPIFPRVETYVTIRSSRRKIRNSF